MRKVIYVLIFATMLITAGLLVVTFLYLPGGGSGENTFTIEADGKTSDTLEFSAEGLVPGSVREYTLKVSSELGGTYTVQLDFVLKGDSVLKDNITVEITGDRVVSGKLGELTDPITFDCTIAKNSSYGIKIRYTLDIEAGNEVKGESIDFDIEVSFV